LLAGRLYEAIADGSLAPGAQLHQENLAERFGVSRSPVREALRLLEARGLVTYYPNRGAVVTAVSEAQIREIFEIRRLLEPRLAELSAAALSRNDLLELRALHARVEAERDAIAWNRLHREFHQRIYATAARPRMLEIVNDNRLRMSDLPDFDAVARSLQEQFAPCDALLLESLTLRDPNAATTATIRHLEILEKSALRRFLPA